jgi:hypothetical protein
VEERDIVLDAPGRNEQIDRATDRFALRPQSLVIIYRFPDQRWTANRNLLKFFERISRDQLASDEFFLKTFQRVDTALRFRNGEHLVVSLNFNRGISIKFNGLT